LVAAKVKVIRCGGDTPLAPIAAKILFAIPQGCKKIAAESGNQLQKKQKSVVYRLFHPTHLFFISFPKIIDNIVS
jgi:hypothetical protein